MAARRCCFDILIDHAMRETPERVDAMLDRVAAAAADPSEDEAFSTLAAAQLLEFPRQRHRALLEDMSQRSGAYFNGDIVELAFSLGKDHPDWEGFDDPWHFYDPAAFAERRSRHLELRRGDAGPRIPYGRILQPHVRAEPKVGRNDPCPCGSGKKYKKCCLGANH